MQSHELQKDKNIDIQSISNNKAYIGATKMKGIKDKGKVEGDGWRIPLIK